LFFGAQVPSDDLTFLCNRGFWSDVTDVDMLENVEIGEQKRRDEAYKAAKKKTGVYVDK
jgi:hypothetical protein